MIQAKIDNGECVITYCRECYCSDCEDYATALDLAYDAPTKEEAINRISAELPMDKAIEYAESMEDLMGFPI